MSTGTLTDARRVIDAAEDHASRIGQPLNIAFVDAGGVPLIRDGVVGGAIGVSGGSGDQDHAVAEAGARAR